MAVAPVSNPLYEGLFLFPQSASAELGHAAAEVRHILDRAGAEVILLAKWDERKLAYPVQGEKRGVYLISYFRCPTSAVAHIERDCNLSESILRVLMLRADHLGDTELDLARREFADLQQLAAEETQTPGSVQSEAVTA